MKKNYQELILNRILSKPKGTIFINSDFKDIVSLETIRKALLRITRKTNVVRIYDGMYTMLQYSNILRKEIFPSTDSIAQAIARRFGWKIYPDAETALNIIGLSTQIPNKHTYLSDGPYRKYEIHGTEINFKRTANKEMNQLSYESIVLIQGLKNIGRSNINKSNINTIREYYINNVKENIENFKKLPDWIFQIIMDIERTK